MLMDLGKDYNRAKEAYQHHIKSLGYRNISFEEFFYRYYRMPQMSIRDIKKIETVDSCNKSASSTSNNYQYGLFSGLDISPISEVDRQTLNRWTKEESLVERWNKLR